MDSFKLDLRNLLGITLPGAIVVLVLLYTIFSAGIALQLPLADVGWIKDQPALAMASLFLVSYALGSLLRLNAAENVDSRSAEYRAQWARGYPGPRPPAVTEDQLTSILDDVVSGRPFPQDRNAIEWVWRNDKFPYPVWEFMKFKLYHPTEMFTFFKSYRPCFGTHELRGKEFFNYCKMVVYHAGRQSGSALAGEVSAAEASVRFYAGAYYAFLISSVLFVTCAGLQGAALLFPVLAGGTIALRSLGLHLAFSVAIVVLIWSKVRTDILKRFRTLRLKEVDIVFDAFYLVHRHAESCSVCAGLTLAGVSAAYAARATLLKDAFRMSQSGCEFAEPLLLDRLVDLMRIRSQEDRSLACLYFAGARGDHPYFLKNNLVAIGLSVLPEDAPKAGLAKKHPKQKEVILVLHGRLQLETEANGKPLSIIKREGDVIVIKEGQGHRIVPIGDEPATYLFLKTHPAAEPREEAWAATGANPVLADGG